MRCEVLLFANLAEAVGEDRLSLELDNAATVSDALDRLASEHPAIGETRSTLAVAVNEQYAASTAELADGDTLALIPPVSGG